MFVLINPPFVSLHRPNLGLSLLKAQLKRDGHPVTLYYADHLLARQVGVDEYSWVHRDNEALIGEWLFSGFVRGDDSWDSRFLQFLRDRGVSAADVEAVERSCGLLGGYLEQVAAEVLALEPRVVGCSSTFQQNNAALAILRAVKARAPQVVTVMGGANLEGEPGEAASLYPWIDFVVSGEAEGCISRLYELCCRHGARIPEGELPAAVGRAGRPAVRGRVDEMDALPYPDFTDYFESIRSLEGIRPTLTLEGSRGCWWGQVKHCTFCGLNGNGMNYRAKSPQRLLDEILTLSSMHGIRQVDMVDNIIAPRHLKDLLPALAEQRGDLRFFWEVKANLKAQHFEQLRAAGVLALQPGIESFSDPVLELMRKGQRSVQNVFVLKAARENGISLTWNLLLGHPGETAEHVLEQRHLVQSLGHFQPPQACCQVRPDRFSPLFAETPEVQPFENYSYVYDLSPEQVRRIAYFFALPTVDRTPDYVAAVDALQRSVARWQSCWQLQQKRTLHFEEGGVRDRRWPGQDVFHELSEQESNVLQAAVSPLRVGELPGELLAGLQERRLGYGDGQMFLSLVLRQDAARLPRVEG